MQYVFLIRSRAGCKKYVKSASSRDVAYFLQPALERIKNTYWMGKRPFLYLYFATALLCYSYNTVWCGLSECAHAHR